MSGGDDEALRRVRAGDKEAYAELVRRHHPPILRLCRSVLGNHADAEDAAQEAFLKAYRSLDRFQGQSSFRTWVYRIASNACTDRLRKRARRKEDPVEDAARLLSRPDPSLDAVEKRDLLQALLSGLPEEQRVALALRETEGLTYEEISKVMETTVDSVKARLRRARSGMIERMRHLEASGDV